MEDCAPRIVVVRGGFIGGGRFFEVPEGVGVKWPAALSRYSRPDRDPLATDLEAARKAGTLVLGTDDPFLRDALAGLGVDLTGVPVAARRRDTLAFAIGTRIVRMVEGSPGVRSTLRVHVPVSVGDGRIHTTPVEADSHFVIAHPGPIGVACSASI